MSLNNFGKDDDDSIKATVSATWESPVKSPYTWNIQELQRLVQEKNDISAKAILDLIDEAKKQAKKLFQIEQDVDDKISKLDKEENNFRENLVRYKNDLQKVNNLIIGVTIVAFIAFIVGFYQITSDNIKQKDLYLKYDILYQSYSNKNEKLKEEINKQNTEIINLKNQIDLLKAKNSYLK